MDLAFVGRKGRHGPHFVGETVVNGGDVGHVRSKLNCSFAFLFWFFSGWLSRLLGSSSGAGFLSVPGEAVIDVSRKDVGEYDTQRDAKDCNDTFVEVRVEVEFDKEFDSDCKGDERAESCGARVFGCVVQSDALPSTQKDEVLCT